MTMRWASKMQIFFRKPENTILTLMILVLGYLIIIPMFSIILDTFTVHHSEISRIRDSQPGDLTTYHWKKVFFDGKGSMDIFYKPLLNTLLVAFSTCAVAITLGGAFAWLVTRTNIPYKSTISTMFMFSFIMPSWTLAMAWINFFKNSRIGGSTGLFTQLTGMETANWFAYGFLPIVIVLGVHYAPFAYIFIGGILRNMDSNLEEAALILKSTRWQIIRKITIPIVLPAFFSTFLLVFSSAISTFAVPAFLGTPVRFQVISIQLYRTLNGMNPGYGYLMALVLIAMGVIVLLINQRIVGKRKSFITVTGKGTNVSLLNLNKFKLPIVIVVFAYLISVAVFPLLSFAIESFLMVPGRYELSNLTTHFWWGDPNPSVASGEPGILRNKYIWNGLWNSLTLSIIVALIAGTAGILAGYAVVKRRGTKLSNVLNNLTFFPYLMPSIGFSAVILSMFAVQRGIIPALYGTFAILVIAGSVKYLPYASRASASVMLQLGNEIEEAAQIQGISWWKRMTRIIFPIQKSSFLSGYLLPFISGMRELSLFILLVTPSTAILTTMLLKYNEKGFDQFANAIVFMIVVVVLGLNYIINKITGASIDKGIGG